MKYLLEVVLAISLASGIYNIPASLPTNHLLAFAKKVLSLLYQHKVNRDHIILYCTTLKSFLHSLPASKLLNRFPRARSFLPHTSLGDVVGFQLNLSERR